MRYIILISVLGILLLAATTPLSGVGGSMVIGLYVLVVAAVVGVHEAWTKKRGVLGWILSIVVSFVGILLAAELGDIVILPVLMLMNFIGLPAVTGGLLTYVALVGGLLLALLGSWGALWIVNRWR